VEDGLAWKGLKNGFRNAVFELARKLLSLS